MPAGARVAVVRAGGAAASASWPAADRVFEAAAEAGAALGAADAFEAKIARAERGGERRAAGTAPL